MSWKFKGSSSGQKFELENVNVWDHEWGDTGEMVEVVDPHYGVKKYFNVYRIELRTLSLEFAAGEFSNSIFGFYTKE